MTPDRTSAADGTFPVPEEVHTLNALAATLADRYEIERELGRGGMATVYLARDLRHDRPVALKVLHPELAQVLGPERFRREIRTAARLQHPHILSVHDSGEGAGRLWFTMPYVDGETLRTRLQRECQLPIADAVRLTREVALALDHAHRHGVVHRDVKPENILLAEDGQALLADFGIARALAAGAGSEGTATALTATGTSIGTPAYMSPEQVAGGRELDGRSDTYSLGCVLYEMLAGEPPFTGPTTQAVLAKRLSGEVPRVRAVRPAVSDVLEVALRCAMAPVPADRFTSAAAFARALEAGATGESAPTVLTPSGPTPGGTAASRVSGRRRLRLGLALLFALLIGAGAFFVWQRSRTSAGPATAAAAGVTRLAVLPFENLGRPEDAYFADGMTDAVRGKLTALSAVEVIARTSSVSYKGTDKTPRQIGQELGVQYLLTGTVRWQRGSGAANRVQVSPELIRTSTAAATWQQPFDAELSDVFQVQTSIAGRVSEALDLALGAKDRKTLAERPTANLEAYDLYLKANQEGEDPGSLRRASQLYERAVVLDTGFVLAWANLAITRTDLWVRLGAHPAGLAAAAKAAANRAVALGPASPQAQGAMARYYYGVEGDPRRAAGEYAQALRLAPNNARILSSAAVVEASLGRWTEALAHSQRAALLDPRSAGVAQGTGTLLLNLRRYPEARAALDQALALAPASLLRIEQRAMVDLAQGDLTAARRVLAAAPPEVDATTRAAFMALYYDLGWVLDDAGQRLVLGLGPDRFSDDRLGWGLALAQVHAFRGDAGEARAYADSARTAAELALRASPDDPQLHSVYGVALARLGRREAAVREAQRGVALMPVAKDAQYGPYLLHQLATVYILLGENEKALDQLEALLKIPYFLSPGWLRIDPTFAPLRGNPRFQRLIQGTG